MKILSRHPVAHAVSLAMIAALASVATLPAQAADGDHVFLNPGDIKWGPAPPTLPPGAKAAVLAGDPGKPGPFVLRLMAPAGYKIPAHWHTQTENLTVISGVLFLGAGDKLDTKGGKALKAGGYHLLPGKAHHYAYSKGPVVIQVHGDGPFDIVYINPDDDPLKGAKK